LSLGVIKIAVSDGRTSSLRTIIEWYRHRATFHGQYV